MKIEHERGSYRRNLAGDRKSGNNRTECYDQNRGNDCQTIPGNTKKMIVLFALASVTLQPLVYLKEFDSFALLSFQYGTLLALVPISMYNGQRGIFNYLLTSIIRYVIIMVITHPAQSLICFNETTV